MEPTEDVRRQLYETVRQHLGETAAEQLMAVTIPPNVQLASKQDVDLLRAEIRADMADIRTGMADLRTELYRRVVPLIGAVVSGVAGVALTILRLMQG